MKQFYKMQLCILLAGLLLLSPAAAFYYEGPSQWAQAEVRAGIDSGLPNHDEEIYFKNEGESLYRRDITRNEFCHVIAQLFGKEKNTLSIHLFESDSPFEDLKRVYWNYDIGICHDYGVIDGMSPTMFGPFENITREQAAKILSRTVKALRPALWTEGKDYFAGKTIADADRISDWARNDIGFVLELGIMQGLADGSFNPQGSFTYEQTMITAYRLARQLELPKMLTVEESALWLDKARANRRFSVFQGRALLRYDGHGDGIQSITIHELRVEGSGVLPKAPGAEISKSFSFVERKIGEGEFWDMGIQYKQGYVRVEADLTIKGTNGKTQKLTDQFIVCF